MISFKGRHFEREMILQSIRWYLAYSLSYRDIEETMIERGFEVGHRTTQRWVVHYAPQLEEAFHKKKKRPGGRWRLDETYVKAKGQWKYLYRAVDKQGNTVDFLLTAERDKKAARRFLNKAIGRNGKPGLISIDKSGANTAAIKDYNEDNHKRIKIRQCKYLNYTVEQDHRRIKRRCRAMLGFKNFHAAQKRLAGIELVHMIKKRTDAGNTGRPSVSRRTVLCVSRVIDQSGQITVRFHVEFATEPVLLPRCSGQTCCITRSAA